MGDSSSASDAFGGRHFVGIDENGMGPRLGPLVVTSILAEADPSVPNAKKLLTSRPRGAIAKRIGDSKKLVAFEDSALGETWARTIARRLGLEARSPDELLGKLCLDTSDELRRPCPSHHADLCWNTAGEAFAGDDASLRGCEKDLDRLEAKGVRILGVRVAILCTRVLNDAIDRGLSRFDLDLHTMERLTLAAHGQVGDEVYALCGKVGGFDFYGERFAHLSGRLFSTLVEGRARSEYAFPKVGRMAFVRDADESHLIVGLASLVGKWVRDHLMRRVVRYHRELVPDLPDASGYHDPVTTRFIRASELVRKERRVDTMCFERRALGRASVPPRATSSESKGSPRLRGDHEKGSRKKKSPPPEQSRLEV